MSTEKGTDGWRYSLSDPGWEEEEAIRSGNRERRREKSKKFRDSEADEGKKGTQSFPQELMRAFKCEVQSMSRTTV